MLTASLRPYQKDPGSGATYYVNEKTKESSWEKPAATPSAAPAAKPLPPGWSVGAHSRLTAPTSAQAAPQPPAPPWHPCTPLAPRALEVRPGLQGPGTTHSCRGAPPRLGPGGSMAVAAWRQHGAGPPPVPKPIALRLPPPSGTDPASGRTYWFNEATKESRWEAP